MDESTSKCKFCGEKIEDNAIFCSKCGAELTSEETTNVLSSEIINTTINGLNENEKPIKKRISSTKDDQEPHSGHLPKYPADS